MNLDPNRSFMIGDRYSDIRAGAAIGTRTILVLTGDGSQEQQQNQDAPLQPDHVVQTLAEAVDVIVETAG
jgi:D-glycero-D-manno-heptose 1,7-bisphosphate phosphatase